MHLRTAGEQTAHLRLRAGNNVAPKRRTGNVGPVSTLLQQMTTQEAVRHETERRRLLAALHAALAALLPGGERVWVFGSLAQSGKFGAHSDLDIALEHRPVASSEFWLQGELELRLGRRVDVVLLPETRLREVPGLHGEGIARGG